jgi:hypothetical protein
VSQQLHKRPPITTTAEVSLLVAIGRPFQASVASHRNSNTTAWTMRPNSKFSKMKLHNNSSAVTARKVHFYFNLIEAANFFFFLAKSNKQRHPIYQSVFFRFLILFVSYISVSRTCVFF